MQATLLNSGFEEPAAKLPFPGWNGYVPEAAGKATLDTSDPHSGRASLHIQKTADADYVQFYSAKPTVAGAEYSAAQDEEWRLSYWVRAEGGAKFSCLLRHSPTTIADTKDGPVNWWTLGGTVPGAKTPWVKREITVEVPKGTGFTYILFALQGPAGSKVWLDDFSLEKVRDLPAIVKPDPPRQLKKLVYLNHPFCYDFTYHVDPDTAAKTGLGEIAAAELLKMERKVSSRWAEEIKKLGPDDGLVINGLAMEQMTMLEGVMAPVWKAARKHMPGRYVVTFSNPGPVEELGRNIQQKFLDNGYTYNPSTLVTEAWGQSTEGCVPNYAGHVAAGMGLPKGFPMRYELTFPDATFAMTGKFIERVAIGDSDVSLYLFEGKDGKPFGIYFPGVVPDKEPVRYVQVAGTATNFDFTTKNGVKTQMTQRDNHFLVPLNVDGLGEPIYIWATDQSQRDFKAVLTAAQVQP